MPPAGPRTPSNGGRAPVVSAWAAAALLVAFLAFLLLSGILDGQPEPERAAAGLSSEAFREVVVGIDREALTERFLPVRPVDRVPLAGDDHEPLTPANSRCLYYEAEGSAALYRFCFADDRLVDKAVVGRKRG